MSMVVYPLDPKTGQEIVPTMKHFGFQITIMQAIRWTLFKISDAELFNEAQDEGSVYWVGSVIRPGQLFELRRLGPWFCFRTKNPIIRKHALKAGWYVKRNDPLTEPGADRFLIFDLKYGKAKEIKTTTSGILTAETVIKTRKESSGADPENCEETQR